MIRHIIAQTVVPAQGSPPKISEEYMSVCLPAFSPEAAHRDEG